jgi:hypothetical protein
VVAGWRLQLAPAPRRRAVREGGDPAKTSACRSGRVRSDGGPRCSCDCGNSRNYEVRRSSSEDNRELLQFERRRLLRHLRSRRQSPLQAHDGRPLLQPLHGLRDAASARKEPGACAALRVVPPVPTESIDLGLIGRLRKAVRRSCIASLHAVGRPVSGDVEASVLARPRRDDIATAEGRWARRSSSGFRSRSDRA